METRRSINEPLRNAPSWEERWGDNVQGFITCWERGREKSREEPKLAARALNGELVSLPWKGGFTSPKVVTEIKAKKPSKQVKKYGVFNYLAMWQGLRGEDLLIDPSIDLELTCPVNKKNVIYTSDASKYSNSVDVEE